MALAMQTKTETKSSPITDQIPNPIESTRDVQIRHMGSDWLDFETSININTTRSTTHSPQPCYQGGVRVHFHFHPHGLLDSFTHMVFKTGLSNDGLCRHMSSRVEDFHEKRNGSAACRTGMVVLGFKQRNAVLAKVGVPTRSTNVRNCRIETNHTYL